MSVTITKQPTNIFPVYNRNYIKLIDSRCTLSDFKYIVRIYYRTSSTGTYILAGTFPVYPTSTGYLEFDAMPIIQNYITNIYNYNFGGVKYTTSMLEYKIVVNTIAQSETSEEKCYTFLGFYTYDGGLQTYQETNYVTNILNNIYPYSSITNSNMSMSNIQTNLNLNLNDFYSADFMLNDVSDEYVSKIKLEVNTTDGIKQYEYSIPSQNATFEKCIASVGIGPKNIQLITWSAITSGASQPFVYDVLSYKIWLQNLSVEKCSKEYNITLDCSKNYKGYDRTWLIYKSKLGGWSYLLFNLRKSKSIDVKKNIYNRKLAYNETYTSRGITTFGNEFSVTHTLNSWWVDKNNQYFFEDLLTSPQVYKLTTNIDGALNTQNPFTPVQIKDGSFKLFNVKDDKLFQYTLDVIEANDYIKQLR